MKIGARFNVEYVVDGTVLAGSIDQRQFATATAQIVVRLETDLRLHLGLYPDIAQFAYDADTFELLIPLLSQEWISTPLRPSENRLLEQACRTGEINVRLISENEEHTLHATVIYSDRWTSSGSSTWSPPSERDRLLLPVGRDGAALMHPNGTRVQKIRSEPAEHVLKLRNLVLPRRSTCVFCNRLHPESREHVVPDWAREEDERGVTVEACEPCNNSLSELESDVADISRRGAALADTLERLIVGAWSIKTIWTISKSLSIDPLDGSGDEYVAALLGRKSTDPGRAEITGIFSTVEPSSDAGFIRFQTSQSSESWVMLRVRNLITSIYFTRPPPTPSVSPESAGTEYRISH